MILYDAVDVKAGSDQVIEIRAGSELVWTRDQFWTFDIPTSGTEIRVTPRFTGSVQIDWGDGNIDTLTNDVATNHIY